jgi:serine/threonine protein kinase
VSIRCPKCDADNPSGSKFCRECAASLPFQEVDVTETLETPAAELTRGTTFASRYEIVEELGRGGMGRVYRAEDKKIKEEVALKLINPEIASDRRTIERFENELKIARKIRHKNVCGMYDLGEENGIYYILMEYVPGEDLKSLIRRVHRLDIGTAIAIAKQVCDGLSEAHRLGIVHRDLKPNNIMIDKEGNARIMDFGIARSPATKGITGKEVMVGTPEFMSPEQVEAKDIDRRTDIYSLGIVLYEMTTGRLPFEADTPFAVGVKQKSEEPRNPRELNAQIPDGLDNLILKCLEKDRENRFKNAREVRSELERIEKAIPTAKLAASRKRPLTSKEITVTFGLKKLFIPTLLLICVVVIGLAIWQPWKRKIPETIALEKPSLVVLPFDDLSPGQDQDYFSVGLMDEIITKLSNVHSLDVISQRASMMLKGSTKDNVTIAKELNVRYILEGSVRKAENNVRITVKLVDTLRDVNIWADDYSGSMDDIFDVQEKIAASLVRSLELELTSEERARLSEQPVNNVLAYEYYLKARQKILEWPGKEELQQALQYLRNGLEIVGENVHIYAAMGYVYFQLYNNGDDASRIKAEEYAQKVFELEPDSPYGHLILGLLDIWQDPRRAFEHLRKVLVSDPNNYDALLWTGYVLIHIGKAEDGQRLLERQLRINPLPAERQTVDGWILMFNGQANLALESLRKVYESYSEDYIAELSYVLALTLSGHNDDASRVIEETGMGGLWQGLSLALEGKGDEVQQWMDNLKPEAKAY